MNESVYIEKFIELSNMLCTKRNDYGSKKNIRVHNKAAKKLFEMREKIKNTMDIAISVYSDLLKNKDSNIRIGAAGHCLNLGINIDESLEILELESKRKDIDALLAFNAEMTLKVYNVEIPNRTL